MILRQTFELSHTRLASIASGTPCPMSDGPLPIRHFFARSLGEAVKARASSRQIPIVGIIAVVAFLGMPRANGSVLAGQTVNLTYFNPNLSTVYTDVGNYSYSGTAPTDFSNVVDSFNVAITDTNINVAFEGSFSFTCCFPFNGFVLTASGLDFTSATPDLATNVTGYVLSFDAHDIYVDLAGVQTNASSVLSVDVAGVASPEPGSVLPLAMTSMAWLAYALFRKGRRNALPASLVRGWDDSNSKPPFRELEGSL